MIPGDPHHTNTFPENASRHFILFVVGDEPNSRLARQNMKNLCQRANAAIEWEVVDVLKDFQTALEHDILATPALVQTAPAPGPTILGNLNDLDRVLGVLGLREPAA
jgi:circadian clock protein KaiB